MTTSQTNKLNMYEAVLKTITDNQTVWQGTNALRETIQEMQQRLAQIRSVSAQRAKSTTGITKTKAERKEYMAKKAVLLAGLAFAYADKQKNEALKATLKYTFSDIFRSSDNAAIDICTAIHQQISGLLPVLADYGITEADSIELQELIAGFAATIGEKGNVKSNSVAGTQTLVTLFGEMDALLKNRLDKLMLRYRDSYAVFFNTYTNARAIHNLGGGKSERKEVKRKKDSVID